MVQQVSIAREAIAFRLGMLELDMLSQQSLMERIVIQEEMSR